MGSTQSSLSARTRPYWYAAARRNTAPLSLRYPRRAIASRVSIAPSSQFPKPRIDVRALLGLYDPADTTDWGPIRAAQLHAGRQLAIFMLAANVVGAALITIILGKIVPAWQLASWSALVAAVAASGAFRRLSSRHRSAVSASLRDVR